MIVILSLASRRRVVYRVHLVVTIARRIEQVSRNVFKVNPGSLLTALQRLERDGSIDAE